MGVRQIRFRTEFAQLRTSAGASAWWRRGRLVRTSFSGATLAAPFLRLFRLREAGDVRAWRFDFTHRSSQPASDVFRRLFQWIVIEVRITCGGRGLRVTEQLADDRQPQSSTRSHRRMRMAQIVNPNARQARAGRDSFPRLLQVGARAINRRSRDDVFAGPAGPKTCTGADIARMAVNHCNPALRIPSTNFAMGLEV